MGPGQSPQKLNSFAYLTPRLPPILRILPSVLWHCWLGVRKSIGPVKIDWWGVGVVICLERGADCMHMVRLMPLHPETPSTLASLKSRLVLPFWHRLTQVVPEKKTLNGCSSSLRIFVISCVLPKVVATSPGITACRLNPPLKPPLSYRTTGRSQPLIGGTCRDVAGHVIQTAVGGPAYKLCQRSGGWSDATSLQVL